MNGNGRYETETLESLLEGLEGFESDESDESDESVRGRGGQRGGRRSAPRTALGTGLFAPRASTQFVKHTELQAALSKVGAQIKTNSDAIQSVSSRVSTQADLLTREVSARKKETDQLKKDLNQTRQMSAIMPLLSRPRSVQLSPASVTTGTPPKALVESDDTLSLLLPLMLMGGMGGMGGSGGGGGGMFGSGGDDGGMTMIVLALLLSKK